MARNRASSFQTEVEQEFSSQGYNRTAIAGILGNSEQESTDNWNTPGGGAWQQITDFGQGTGGSPLNQMKALLTGLNPFKSQLNSANSPSEAADIVEQDYEKAGIPALSNRQRYASQAYSAIGGSASAGTALSRMQAEASGIVAKGYPYVSGGGHGQLGVPSGSPAGFDCSGFVSAVLGAGGYVTAPQTTQTLHTQGTLSPGTGLVTIYDRYTGAVSQEHVIMNLAGTWYESGGSNSAGPHVMTSAAAASQLAQGGFQPFHPSGMNRNTVGSDADKYSIGRPGGDPAASGDGSGSDPSGLTGFLDAAKFVLEPSSILRAVELLIGLGMMLVGLLMTMDTIDASDLTDAAAGPGRIIRDAGEATVAGAVLRERSGYREGQRHARQKRQRDQRNAAYVRGVAGTPRRAPRVRKAPAEDIPF